MTNTYGRTVLTPTVDNQITLLANLTHARWHPVGITVDWTTVTAVVGDVTLPDYLVVPDGTKALRYGQILCRATLGAGAGLWGPYDAAAVDGRATLTRGLCVALNETVLENGPVPALGTSAASAHPPVLDGGLVWQARLLDSTHVDPLGQPLGPTFAALEAVLDLEYVIA